MMIGEASELVTGIRALAEEAMLLCRLYVKKRR